MSERLFILAHGGFFVIHWLKLFVIQTLAHILLPYWTYVYEYHFFLQTVVNFRK